MADNPSVDLARVAGDNSAASAALDLLRAMIHPRLLSDGDALICCWDPRRRGAAPVGQVRSPRVGMRQTRRRKSTRSTCSIPPTVREYLAYSRRPGGRPARKACAGP